MKALFTDDRKSYFFKLGGSRICIEFSSELFFIIIIVFLDWKISLSHSIFEFYLVQLFIWTTELLLCINHHFNYNLNYFNEIIWQNKPKLLI